MREVIDSMSRQNKRLVLFGFDLVLIPIALFLGIAVRFGTFTPGWLLADAWPLFPITLFLGAIAVLALGLPRIKLSTFERNGIFKVAICSVFLAFVAMVGSYFLGLTGPRSVPLAFGSCYFVLSTVGHLIGQTIVVSLAEPVIRAKRVIIYGAGQSGIQLATAFGQTHQVKPVAFVDDNLAKKGTLIGSVPVLYTDDLETAVIERKVDQIVLAMPSASPARRAEILNRLSELQVEVMALPSFLELLSGKELVESLEPVSLEDLLGRDMVDLDLPEVEDTYAGKVVMVTGGGGSIGAELCRQLVSCHISKLVIFEHSELALYEIDKELRALTSGTSIRIVSVLGSATHVGLVGSVLEQHKVQIVLHAAAYKHVPLVENNELAGLQNNVVGTRTVADAAIRAKCERFILVSTDKAVRPTNVMGASKRLAEMVVQDLATRSKTTLLSMVRFGNVLGSSGSVIPLFKTQIEAGGPVTVTDAEVTRYFMTISEASRLVLLAGCFARGGDVFVLDMGKPVKIYDLAKSLIELSGLSLRNSENPNGDIEIAITGLRPGEKLYEELLIGDDMLTTPHGKILRAQETKLSEIEIASMTKELEQAFANTEHDQARLIVKRWVEGYQPPKVGSAEV